ncbi:M23 family metallopeptidase [Corynebacterium halotolerans]|uniref:M23ase beta-sheet core domain-containing protein n=1 Tax=Corynebacterium halotolerans YIM 70093 = DSM 44683 TaxID=1121362 RepID=M1NZ30_9CORY|nr:M23 family metallopeptidase [Corynebacterium halotolerans]AGF72775.1 hypothetical protein A605_08865 [Corynebacterium halotolerans YIM 70093 = DSM 44683]
MRLPHRRVPASLLAVAATVAITATVSFPAAPSAAAYVDPTTGGSVATRVTRAFNKPEHNWLPGHRGVDLALGIGEPVVAAGDGVVAHAGVVAGTPVVSVDHDDGVRTTYQPVHARVRQGEEVAEGQAIGTLGHPVDGYPGLHWGARSGPDRDEYLNPLSLLDAPTIRLKPF